MKNSNRLTLTRVRAGYHFVLLDGVDIGTVIKRRRGWEAQATQYDQYGYEQGPLSLSQYYDTRREAADAILRDYSAQKAWRFCP